MEPRTGHQADNKSREAKEATHKGHDSPYLSSINQIATTLKQHEGPIVTVAHVDPDGDALGSTLAMKRALETLGKSVTLPMKDLPSFLHFIVAEGELVPPLTTLQPNTLVLALDSADAARVSGAPLEQAAFTINVDHHGTNNHFGDMALVSADKAATAQMVKDIIDALDLPWNTELATPCLTGILTDTGNLRFANTTPDVLHDVATLIGYGVPYAELTDRLQWRSPDYFKMLGLVMSTVSFPLEGRVAMAHIDQAMRDAIGPTDDDSDDYVGQIRYATGTHVAIFFKQRAEHTKISVRSRGEVSAQRICQALGGGGHHAAAGSTLHHMSVEQAKVKVLPVVEHELSTLGLL